MSDPLLSFLGIVKKSGNLVFGMDSVKKYCLDGKVKLILLTSDISKNSFDKIVQFLRNLSIKYVIIDFTKEDINLHLKKYVAILGVLDVGMADKILSLNSNNLNSERNDVYNDKI